MATEDFSWAPLEPSSFFTGDPANEGYRQVYTFRSPVLPSKIETPGQVENINYPGWADWPVFNFLFTPNNVAEFFAQVDAAVTAVWPGAEDQFDPGFIVPAIMRDYTYRAENVPGDGSFGHFNNCVVDFFYEVFVPSTGETKQIVTEKYYHPNADIQISISEVLTPVEVVERFGLVVRYRPGEMRFKDELVGFTPSEPWHPGASVVGIGFPEMRLHDKEPASEPLVYASTDWTVILGSISVSIPH